ncbi:hypothetical protein HKX48_006496 [Thoreauomyces humboldtii]|nr:hypothetical protein HKX48_006496 [Thoreauomyces humboldtii]
MENQHLYLLQAEEDNHALEAKLQIQDDEMAGLISGGDAPYLTELRTLREDNEDLEKRIDALTGNLAETEAHLAAERTVVREATANLNAEKARASAAEELASRMKAEIKDYQSQLKDRKDRIQLKNMDDDQFRKQLREKNGELARYLAEVELLSSENARLTQEVESLTQEVEVTVTELERKEREQLETQQMATNHDLIIDQLNAEKIALRTKLEDLTHQVEKAGSRDERFLSELQAEVRHYERAIQISESESTAKDVVIEQLQADTANMRQELQSSHVGNYQKELVEKDELIQTLQSKLDESYRDFELLSMDWNKIDQAMQNKSGVDLEALRSQIDGVHRSKDKLEAYKARHRKTLNKIKAADEQLEEKEKDIVQLQTRIAKYESGVYGLPEAAKEIKQLQLRLRAKEKEILTRTQQLNVLERQVGEFVDENTALRQRLGIKEASKIDVSNIQDILSVELEKSKALTSRLRTEIDGLEEERLQMKSTMRLHALEKGERAVKLGMTAADFTEVEDYAERLRIKNAKARRSKSRESTIAPVAIASEQLDRLAVELERAQVDGSEARQEAKRLEAEARILKNDKSRLEAAIREVSLSLVQLRHSRESDNEDGPVQPFRAVNKLLELLEKRQRLGVDDTLVDLDSEKHVISVNTTLRGEVQAATEKLGVARRDAEDLRARLFDLTEDRDHWKAIAQKPAKRAVELPASLQMGSQADYEILAEKVVICLEEMKSKDSVIQQSEQALKKYMDLYGALAGRQRQLYRNYQTLKTESHERTSKSTLQLREAINAKEAAELQSASLQKTLKVLEGPPEDIKSQYISAQRTCTVMKVNEKALTRRYEALQEVEGALRRDHARTQSDFIALEKAAKERMTRLEVTKRAAQVKVDRLLNDLAETVPAVDHMQLENKLHLYIAKTKHLLEKEQHWLEEKGRIGSQAQEIKTLLAQLEQTKSSLREAREMTKRAEADFLTLTEEKGPDAEARASDMNRISILEVQVGILLNRAQIAEQKCTSMTASETEIKNRMDSMDRLYMEAKEENYKLREAELELRNSFVGGASREENEKKELRISHLESNLESLRQDVANYKNVAAVATTQASDLMSRRELDETEKNILRAAVEELQMEGDDKLIIGKLHQQILELKISHASGLRQNQQLGEKVATLESTVVQLEKELDDRDNAIFHLRIEQKKRMRLSQKSVSELRSRLAGSVVLTKYERTCQRLRDIDARKVGLANDLEVLLAEKQHLEDQLAETTQKSSSLAELIETLKDHSASTERLAAWHSKMSALQLADLRLQRELGKEREASNSAKRELTDTVAQLTQLEDAYAELQSETDSRQIEWEKRQDELENLIGQFEEERDHIFSDTSADDLRDVLPNRALPIGQQLETALRQLVDRSKVLKAQGVKISTLEGKLRTLEVENRESVDQLDKSRGDITSLRLELTATAIKPQVEQTPAPLPLVEAEPVDNRAEIRQREAAAIKIARESIDSLQRQLAAKDMLVEKYRGMLVSLREDMAQHQSEYSQALQERTETINNLADREVERLRKPPHMTAPNHAHPSTSDGDTATITEMMSLVSAKEAEIASLQVRLDQNIQDAERRQTKLKDIEEGLRKNLISKQEEIDALAVKIEEVEELLRDALVRAAEPPSKKTLDLVLKLQEDLDSNDAKQARLKQVITELRTSMVETAESATKRIIENQHQRGDVEQTVQRRTHELRTKIADLETKLRAVSDASIHDETAAKTAALANEQIAQRDRRIEAHVAETRKLQGALRDLRLKVERLTEERNRFKQEVASATEKKVSQRPPSGSARKVSGGEVAAKDTDLSRDKWELEKKHQRRLDGLKDKLADKTKEAEEAERTIATLRNTLNRTERERTRLQHKLQAAPGSGRTVSAGNAEQLLADQKRDFASDLEALRKTIFTLEEELQQARKQATPPNEEGMLRQEARQLQARIVVLEEINAHLRKSLVETREDTGGDAEANADDPISLDQRARDLLAKYEASEAEKLKSESACLALKTACDEALNAQRRNGRRITEMQEYIAEIEAAETARVSDEDTISVSGQTISFSKLRSASHVLRDQSPAVLLSIIETIARICERYRLETQSIKRNGTTQTKHMEAVHEIKKLKTELAEHAEQRRSAEHIERKAKQIEEENAKLRKQMRTDKDKYLKLVARSKEVEIERDKLLSGLNIAAERTEPEDTVSQIKELTAQLTERDNMIQGLLAPKDDEKGKQSKTRKLEQELDMWRTRASKLSDQLAAAESALRQVPKPVEDAADLRRQLQDAEALTSELKEELAAFDPAFFEELEDLKWNHNESVRLNVQYEDVIRTLSRQLGVDPEETLIAAQDP